MEDYGVAIRRLKQLKLYMYSSWMVFLRDSTQFVM